MKKITLLFTTLLASLSMTRAFSQDKVSAAVAGSAVTMPVWHNWLEQASNYAGLLAPIAGLCLTIVLVYKNVKSIKK